jgi:hypothetical protein
MPEQLAEDLVSKGAKMIFTSDDSSDGAVAFAKAHPTSCRVHPGDSA